MILIDANLLVYAHVKEFPHHDASRAWLDDQISTQPRVALPWPSLLAFLRLVTNPRIFERPEPVGSAWRQIQSWIGAEPVWIPGPTERHAEILGSLVHQAVDRANLVPDAHLAALGIEHGLTVCTTDRDFARFPGVRWQNPLA